MTFVIHLTSVSDISWFLFTVLDNQERTLKCWYVMPATRATTPSVSSRPWIQFPLTPGSAGSVPFITCLENLVCIYVSNISNAFYYYPPQRCRVCTECGIQGLMLPGSSQWFDNYSVCETCQCQRSSVCAVCSKPTSPTMALQSCSLCHRFVKGTKSNHSLAATGDRMFNIFLNKTLLLLQVGPQRVCNNNDGAVGSQVHMSALQGAAARPSAKHSRSWKQGDNWWEWRTGRFGRDDNPNRCWDGNRWAHGLIRGDTWSDRHIGDGTDRSSSQHRDAHGPR